MQLTDLKGWMEDSADNLERWVGAAAEAAKIAERVMKKSSEEYRVKVAAAKDVHSVSSAGILSAATSMSTAASATVRIPNFTSSVVGVSRRSGYTLIIIIL